MKSSSSDPADRRVRKTSVAEEVDSAREEVSSADGVSAEDKAASASKPLGKRRQQTPAQPEVSADTVAQLYFDLLKQIIMFALASAGGAITLLQTLLESGPERLVAMAGIAALLLAAIMALIAQEYLVERLGKQTRTMRPFFFVPSWMRAPRTPRVERAFFVGSILMFGLGLGLVVVSALGLFEV